MRKDLLPIAEELDFAYLLALMPALHDVPQFSWLPELFSIIGHERLLTLCKYCGGETITLPTLDSLSTAIDALQNFYDVYIARRKMVDDIPQDVKDLVDIIADRFEGNS